MPPKKVFVDDNEPKVEMVVEEEKPEKKQRKKRAPLSEEQKKALVERLALARAAKKNARSGTEPPKKNARAPKKEPAKPKKEKKKKSPIKKQEPEKNSYREHQLELASLRQEMENQRLKFEIESLKKNKSKPAPIVPMETIKEEPIVQKEKQQSVSKIEKVDEPKTVVNSVPVQEVPKPIRKNLANKGCLWQMIRNS